MYDFHTHTFLSDGVLSPIELIRRASVIGYKVMAVTDHVGPGNLEHVLKILIRDCEMASNNWDILAVPGVEITHVPVSDIDLVARESRAMGAQVVNVHGETFVEPVEPGTNLAAVMSQYVNVLAHPGLITLEEANLAAKNNVFLEVSARNGHGFANGHVVKMARESGAKLILDSDAHEPGDLLTREIAENVARGAGLDDVAVSELLDQTPKLLIRDLKAGKNMIHS